jgi:outer membrane protein assembly factor BamE (lipoprotein component of BamABCDE complex)
MKGFAFALFLAIALLLGCATQQSGGLGKPSVFSSPVIYMETVGLDIYTREDVLRVLGNPHNVAILGGREYWAYVMGEGYGERTYTYIFRGKRFVDVRYNDNGPYNGITARKSQIK